MAGLGFADEEPVLLAYGRGPDGVLDPVVVDGDAALAQECSERGPLREGAGDGSAQRAGPACAWRNWSSMSAMRFALRVCRLRSRATRWRGILTWCRSANASPTLLVTTSALPRQNPRESTAKFER